MIRSFSYPSNKLGPLEEIWGEGVKGLEFSSYENKENYTIVV